MSFLATRNAIGVGLSGIVALSDSPRSEPIPPPVLGDAILQEDGFYLLQEDGSKILLETA